MCANIFLFFLLLEIFFYMNVNGLSIKGATGANFKISDQEVHQLSELKNETLQESLSTIKQQQRNACTNECLKTENRFRSMCAEWNRNDDPTSLAECLKDAEELVAECNNSCSFEYHEYSH